eukprot:6469772-Amphidinium_carterae.1
MIAAELVVILRGALTCSAFRIGHELGDGGGNATLVRRTVQEPGSLPTNKTTMWAAKNTGLPKQPRVCGRAQHKWIKHQEV